MISFDTEIMENNTFDVEDAGTIALDFLPRKLQNFKLYSVNSFQGTVDTKMLPETLIAFDVSSNRLSGSVDARRFPPKLLEIDLSANEFEGSFDLTALPPKLLSINVSGNNLRGSVNLTKLPRELKDLEIGHNLLSGRIRLENLPPKLESLRGCFNDFTGEFHLFSAPEGLCIDFSMTRITGNVLIASTVPQSVAIKLYMNDLSIVMDENARRHPSERKILMKDLIARRRHKDTIFKNNA